MLPQQSSTILISHVTVTLGTDKTSKSQHIPKRELLPRFGQTFTKSVVWRRVTWPRNILFNFCKMIFRLTAGQGQKRKITKQNPEMYCCSSPTLSIYGPSATKMWDENQPDYGETGWRKSEANSESRHSKTTLYVQLINHFELIQGVSLESAISTAAVLVALPHMKPASHRNPLRFTVPDFAEVWKYQPPACKYARALCEYIATCDSTLILTSQNFASNIVFQSLQIAWNVIHFLFVCHLRQ